MGVRQPILPSSRRQPVTLTTELFVNAAIDLVEEQGTEALTMRALAERLDVAVGTAYRYIPDKETLLQHVANTILSQVTIPTEGDWYERLISFQIDVLSTLKRHPGASTYVFNQTKITPQSEITRNALAALLVEGGLKEDQAQQGVLAIATVVAGSLTMGQLRSDEEDKELFRFILDTILQGLGLLPNGPGSSKARRGKAARFLR
jgi:TetR/AcrR family tetracycline transcriptional repressor